MAVGWRAGYGVWAFGILSILLAIVAYAVLDEPYDAMSAFALGIVGLFALLVIRERSVSARTSEAILQGSARSLDDLARGLSLKGRASVIPPAGSLTRDRLFLAAAESEKPLPVLDDVTVVYAGPATVRIGVATEPPGAPLVARWETATGRKFADTPVGALQSTLAGMGLSEGLFRDLRIRETQGSYQISFRPLELVPPCMESTRTERLPCERTACSLCSVACIGLARALARPVTIAAARIEGGAIELDLDAEGRA